MFYAYIINDVLTNDGKAPLEADGLINVEITDEIHQHLDHYIWDKNNQTIVLNPNYEEEQAEKEKERIAALSLTKREVFLALYRAAGITPDMIKTQIGDNIEALIEFEYAEKYYRFNPLINSIGALLGYSPEDLDYLFIHKELPER